MNRLLDKPLYKSLTIYGLLVIAAAEALCMSGTLPPGVCSVIKTIGEILALFGIRKATTTLPVFDEPDHPEETKPAPVAATVEDAAKGLSEMLEKKQ